MKRILFILLLLLGNLSWGQQSTHVHTHACGSDHVNQRFFAANPLYKTNHDRFEERLARVSQNGTIASMTTLADDQVLEVPIVVHIMHQGEQVGTGTNFSDQQIINWVNYTNQILAGTANGFLSEENGGAKIPFRLVLAKRDPNCQATTGITRHNLGGVSNYVAAGLDMDSNAPIGVTENYIKSIVRWNPENYYNVYVVNKITDAQLPPNMLTLGYAYFPSVSNTVYGTFMASMVVNTSSTTFAHEFGHSLGLSHTFEGSNSSLCPPFIETEANCLTVGDRVCDTQPTMNGNYMPYPKPTNSQINPCVGINYDGTQYNIMNYGTELNRFTQGQKQRAIAQFMQFRSSLVLNNNALVDPIDTNETTIVAASCTPPLSLLYPQIGNHGIGHTRVMINESSFSSEPISSSNYPNIVYKDYALNCLNNPIVRISPLEVNTITVGVNSFANPFNVRMFIDWNNDGVFSESEAYTQHYLQLENQSVTYGLAIPENAVTNQPLRVRVISNYGASINGACVQLNYGKAEDLYIIVDTADIPVCYNVDYDYQIISNTPLSLAFGETISLKTSSVVPKGAGILYTWQKSSDQISWVDLSNTTSYTGNFTSGANQWYYRLKVSCTESDQVTYSNIITVEKSYCTININYLDEKFNSITIDNQYFHLSTYNSKYIDKRDSNIPLEAGTTFELKSVLDMFYVGDKLAVWIDVNNDKVFDSEELVISSSLSNEEENFTVSVPDIFTSSVTVTMRVLLYYNYSNIIFGPCGNYEYGQYVDFSVTINKTPIGWTGVVSSDWNNPLNWNPQTVPVGNDLAKILESPNNPIINSDVTIGSITVDPNAYLTITKEGNLFQNEGVVNQGEFRIEKETSPLVRQKMAMWSSPVNTFDLRALSGFTLANRVYYYDGTQASVYVPFTTQLNTYMHTMPSADVNFQGGNTNFELGRGYFYRVPNTFSNTVPTSHNGIFVGNVNNGTINAPALKQGFHSFGNPYPSPLNVDEFLIQNYTTGENYKGVWGIYLFDEQSQTFSTAYNLSGSSEPDMDNLHIGKAEGFLAWIDAPIADDTYQVQFNNSMRGSSGIGNRMVVERHRIWLGISQQGTSVQNTLLSYSEGATLGVDPQLDSPLLDQGVTTIYTMINQNRYTIQGRPLPFDIEDEVSLGYRAQVAGTYTIQLSASDGIFAEGQEVYLKDNLTQNVVNLSQGSYEFVTDAGLFDDRFQVLYRNTLSVDNPNGIEAKWITYTQEDKLHIATSSLDLDKVELYDLLGRVIYTSKATGTTHQISRFGAQQVVIVKITTKDGVQLSKKANF